MPVLEQKETDEMSASNKRRDWHIAEILKQEKTSFSFEFFPPKSEDASRRLFKTIEDLARLDPCYVSVTYGAGGATRRLTYELLLQIKKHTDIPVVSHLTCVGADRDEIYDLLQKYWDSGIRNILALRGDPPEGEEHFTPPENGFRNSSELVAFIREHFPDMGIGVAGYPEGHFQTPNRLEEIENMKKKVDAGAEYICTQLFFDNHDFYDFCERCEYAGIDVPIIAGIMPVTSKKGLYKMAELSAGSRMPAKLLKAVDCAESEEYVENVGIHWATAQIMDLIDNGVQGIHLFTLNKSSAALRIYESLGVTSTKQLHDYGVVE